MCSIPLAPKRERGRDREKENKQRRENTGYGGVGGATDEQITALTLFPLSITLLPGQVASIGLHLFGSTTADRHLRVIYKTLFFFFTCKSTKF